VSAKRLVRHLFFAGAFVAIVPVFLKQRGHGETFTEAYFAVPARAAREGLTPAEIGLGLLFWVGLFWITFFSNYKRVTEDDKRFVRLWVASMVVMELVHAARHIVGAL
jgi:hypothetical protein